MMDTAGLYAACMGASFQIAVLWRWLGLGKLLEEAAARKERDDG